MPIYGGRGRFFRRRDEICICPVCGYTTIHELGVPCNSIRCPRCDEPLIRL